MLILVPAEPVLDGSFRLHVEASGGLPEGGVQMLLDLLQDLALVGTRGGFSPSDVRRARFQLIRFEASPGTIVADLDLGSVDRRFLRCIQSVLAALQLTEQISALRLFEATRADRTQRDDWEAADDTSPFPEPRASLSFATATDSTISARMRTVVITLGTRATPLHADELRTWLAPWGRILERGAFALPLEYPEEARSLYAGVQLFEADSLEVVIDRFDAHESAFDVLTNMLDSLARTGFPIVTVARY